MSLVCMGWLTVEPSDEDTLCARYIESLLKNEQLDLYSEVEKLRTTSGAKFFDPQQWKVFPKDDFSMCTDVDRFNFVLKLEKNGQGMPYIKRIRL